MFRNQDIDSRPAQGQDSLPGVIKAEHAKEGVVSLIRFRITGYGKIMIINNLAIYNGLSSNVRFGAQALWMNLVADTFSRVISCAPLLKCYY